MSDLAIIEKEICNDLTYNTEKEVTEVALNAYKNVKKSVIQFGVILIKAKEVLPHGTFEKWIDENFDFSIRTARNYINTAIRFYPKWDEIEQMDKASFKVLKTISKEIQEEILSQEEIDGKSLGDLTKEDILNYEEKRKAEIKSLELKNRELNRALKEKNELIKEQETQIENGMKEYQDLEKELYEIKKPENLQAEQEREAGNMNNEIIVMMRQLFNFENLSEQAKIRFIADLNTAIADGKKEWGL